MKLVPQVSLGFDGRCEQAFRFYERCLGATIEGLFTYDGSPMAAAAPPGWGGKVMHATLKVGDRVISGADPLPAHYQKPQGFSILLQMDDAMKAERVFAALSEGARIEVPLAETFWAQRFGALVDQFGIPWSINCE